MRGEGSAISLFAGESWIPTRLSEDVSYHVSYRLRLKLTVVGLGLGEVLVVAQARLPIQRRFFSVCCQDKLALDRKEREKRFEEKSITELNHRQVSSTPQTPPPAHHGREKGRMKANPHSGHPFSAAAHWDLEQSYENQPRSGNKKRKTKEKPERTRLPIKTATGIVQVPNLPSATTIDEDTESVSDDDEEDEGEKDGIDPSETSLPPAAPATVAKPLPLRKRVIIAKEKLANIATLINEDPEENVGLLKGLKEVYDDAAVQIKMLAIGTMLSVYKDLVPGYRIRALSEEEMKAKVTKEVRKVRGFEQALVSGYSGFVKMLGGLARGLISFVFS